MCCALSVVNMIVAFDFSYNSFAGPELYKEYWKLKKILNIIFKQMWVDHKAQFRILLRA